MAAKPKPKPKAKVTGTNYSTADNIRYAKSMKSIMDASVAVDKKPKQLPGAMGLQQSKTKAERLMRVRQSIDASKTAGRAKNVESKLKKAKEPTFNPKYFKNNLDAAALAKAKAKAKAKKNK